MYAFICTFIVQKQIIVKDNNYMATCNNTEQQPVL